VIGRGERAVCDRCGAPFTFLTDRDGRVAQLCECGVAPVAQPPPTPAERAARYRNGPPTTWSTVGGKRRRWGRGS